MTHLEWRIQMDHVGTPSICVFATFLSVVLVGCGGPDAPQGKDAAEQAEHENHKHGDMEANLKELSDAERAAVKQQKTCPVSGETLGAMGKPVRVMVDGKEVWICCSACKEPLLKDPEKHLKKLNP